MKTQGTQGTQRFRKGSNATQRDDLARVEIRYGEHSVTDEDIRRVVEVLQSPFLTQGPVVEQFEAELCKVVGAKYAVVFNSGTAALHAAYFALGLSKGQTLLTTPNTFAATANAAAYLGAGVEFCDIDHTYNMDVHSLGDYITPQTTIITPVHYGGYPCNMAEVARVARASGLSGSNPLRVVEDASHALGGTYCDSGGRYPVGSCKYSDITTFSFHPIKHVAAGEGGAATTNDANLYNKMKLFRNHGIQRDNFVGESHGSHYMEMVELGYNYRMSEIHAALGMSQLSRLEENIKRRRSIAAFYANALKGNSMVHVAPEPYDESGSMDGSLLRGQGQASADFHGGHAFHLYPILLDKSIDRGQVLDYMRSRGIGVQVLYMPVYMHPYHRNHGHQNTSRATAENFYKRSFTLPIHPSLEVEDLEFVVQTLNEGMEAAKGS